MVLGADADVSGWLEALGSKEGWEVISGETDRKDIDVIVLGSDGDVNADWLAAFKEKQTECLVLASRLIHGCILCESAAGMACP